ncbi:hypothetical protein M8818_001269 [Zalaria obscura]|uniref:Uncharacterized protein n=1 Tax=Zalaria obscura TaxID=2024903 RepID=A0ACC3SLL5_9PEZI
MNAWDYTDGWPTDGNYSRPPARLPGWGFSYFNSLGGPNNGMTPSGCYSYGAWGCPSDPNTHYRAHFRKKWNGR